MLRPNTIPACGQYPVRIDCVFQRFVKAQQRVIVERVGIHHRRLMRGRGAIFSPTVLRCDFHQLLELGAILLVGFDIVRDWETEKEDESAVPITSREAEGWNGQAQVLRGLAKHAIRLENSFAVSGNDWREPNMPLAGRGIGGRACADRKHLQAGDAELGQIEMRLLLGSQGQLHRSAVFEFGSWNG